MPETMDITALLRALARKNQFYQYRGTFMGEISRRERFVFSSIQNECSFTLRRPSTDAAERAVRVYLALAAASVVRPRKVSYVSVANLSRIYVTLP